MIEFILENWKFLLEIFLLVLSFFLLLLKKKAKIVIDDKVLASLFREIPVWISEAEDIYSSGNGENKFLFVCNKALQYIADSLSISIKEIPGSLILEIKEMIEDVLSTPIKKEALKECSKEN